ncbi:Tricarboxylate/iron carrier [Zopfochytrium polystomum]|nr:Tricarboxylate/iron carrier [Zopfochytrium polystomum]
MAAASPDGILLRAAQSLIASHTATHGATVAVPAATADALWRAKVRVDATIHPDTGEKVLLPFRMASFVPTNALVVAGMLMSRPIAVNIVAWQWVNQTVNVAFNYANANKTTKMDFSETAVAYATAVASSCTIAIGLNEWVKRLKGLSPMSMSILNKCVPFTAVAAAGTLNVFLMRRKEMTDGIAVMDSEGKIVGKSAVAGYTAISQVAISRVATAFPAVFLPGLVMTQLERTAVMQRNPRLALPANLVTISLSLLGALPCAIALFPQVAAVPATSLEPRFHNLVDSGGAPVKELYFNRGL